MKTKKLHPTQKKLLDILVKNIDDQLSIRDMQEMLGISSTSVVVHHLRQLEKNGYLKKNPYNPRDYQIIKGAPEKQITYLNLYGLAHCGPNGSILDGNPIDRIAISTRLLTFPSSEAFMVKAKGDSMAPKINEGDLIIVKKADDAENGSIVACVNDGEREETNAVKNEDEIGDKENKRPDVDARSSGPERIIRGEAKVNNGDFDSEHSITQYKLFSNLKLNGVDSWLIIGVPIGTKELMGVILDRELDDNNRKNVAVWER